jgi:hypothetical protein
MNEGTSFRSKDTISLQWSSESKSHDKLAFNFIWSFGYHKRFIPPFSVVNLNSTVILLFRIKNTGQSHQLPLTLGCELQYSAAQGQLCLLIAGRIPLRGSLHPGHPRVRPGKVPLHNGPCCDSPAITQIPIGSWHMSTYNSQTPTQFIKLPNYYLLLTHPHSLILSIYYPIIYPF